MNKVNPSVMRRLRKILALSNSSEPGEAAAALHQAKKLMEAHGLSSDDVETSDINESEARLGGASVPGWENHLISVVAQSLDVGVLIRSAVPVAGARRQNATVVFVGHGSNAVVAQYAFTRLRGLLKKNLEELVRLALAGTPYQGRRASVTPAAREAYARGWCFAIASKVSALGAGEPSPSVARYVQERTDGAAAAEVKNARSKNDSAAHVFGAAGFRDGTRVEIHKAVHGAQPQAMLAC